jgi:3-methylcrotonyl-CoA carboxylase alpha subunit
VRIDAGFVQGDEVSSHYDPMIAKLIVSGPDRKTALQKLNEALEQYEIAGPVTNIEFLKRVSMSQQFMDGEVETGYIPKHHDELFAHVPLGPETWAQAAIGLYAIEQTRQNGIAPSLPLQTIGYGNAPQPREFHLVETSSDPQKPNEPVPVRVLKTGPETYEVTVQNASYSITSKYDGRTGMLQSFFPHTRLDTTLVKDPETNYLTVFQQGRQYGIHLATPKWAEKALGMRDMAHSVLAPMPCKVLRVEVEQGQEVKKNQALVVIESMKMETVIRSPQDGKIGKIVHKAGDLCKAGTALVEFEGEDDK